MRINETGQYKVTEGELFIVDPETGERLLFCVDREKGIVIRSMTEQDIKEVVSNMDASSSEKRKKMKLLWQEIPKKGSELYFFVAEKIIEEDNETSWNRVYELQRHPIGLGVRSDQTIEVDIYENDKAKSMDVLKLVNQVADYFGIKGKGWIMPAKY